MLSAYSHGKSNFWYGVVEDINDPEMLGRIRVRVFGYHSEDKQDIPTNVQLCLGNPQSQTG